MAISDPENIPTNGASMVNGRESSRYSLNPGFGIEAVPDSVTPELPAVFCDVESIVI
ncbi:MAG TPA: hypothetical protein VGB30_09130 [bacterium]